MSILSLFPLFHFSFRGALRDQPLSATSAARENLRHTAAAALESAHPREVLHHGNRRHVVHVDHPLLLTLVATEHPPLGVHVGRDVHITIGDEVHAADRVHVNDFGNLHARRMVGHDVRHRDHHVRVPNDPAGGRVIGMVVVLGIVAEDQIRPDLPHQLDEPQPGRGVVEQEFVGIAQPVELRADHGGRSRGLGAANRGDFGLRHGRRTDLAVGGDRHRHLMADPLVLGQRAGTEKFEVVRMGADG